MVRGRRHEIHAIAGDRLPTFISLTYLYYAQNDIVYAICDIYYIWYLLYDVYYIHLSLFHIYIAYRMTLCMQYVIIYYIYHMRYTSYVIHMIYTAYDEWSGIYIPSLDLHIPYLYYIQNDIVCAMYGIHTHTCTHTHAHTHADPTKYTRNLIFRWKFFKIVCISYYIYIYIWYDIFYIYILKNHRCSGLL